MRRSRGVAAVMGAGQVAAAPGAPALGRRGVAAVAAWVLAAAVLPAALAGCVAAAAFLSYRVDPDWSYKAVAAGLVVAGVVAGSGAALGWWAHRGGVAALPGWAALACAAAFVAAVVVGVAVAEPNPGRVHPRVVNQTGGVVLVYRGSTTNAPWAKLQPGESSDVVEEDLDPVTKCTHGEMTARRDTDGALMGETGPLCAGAVWVIGGGTP